MSRLGELTADSKRVFIYFYQETGLDISCKLSPLETICMKCQNLFSGENISICCLLKILPRVLSVKLYRDDGRVIMKSRMVMS